MNEKGAWLRTSGDVPTWRIRAARIIALASLPLAAGAAGGAYLLSGLLWYPEGRLSNADRTLISAVFVLPIFGLAPANLRAVGMLLAGAWRRHVLYIAISFVYLAVFVCGLSLGSFTRP